MTNERAIVVAMVATKGGVGKTTLAYGVAETLLERGESVTLCDADPQSSACKVHSLRTDACPTLDVFDVSELTADDLYLAIEETASQTGWVLVDTPGWNGGTDVALLARLRVALAVADVVLVPCGPSPLDVWEVEDVLEEVAAVRLVRPGMAEPWIVITQDAPRTRIARQVVAMVEEMEEGKVAPHSLPRRTAHRDAMALGMGAAAHSPSSRAAADLRLIVDWLETLVVSNASGGSEATQALSVAV